MVLSGLDIPEYASSRRGEFSTDAACLLTLNPSCDDPLFQNLPFPFRAGSSESDSLTTAFASHILLRHLRGQRFDFDRVRGWLEKEKYEGDEGLAKTEELGPRFKSSARGFTKVRTQCFPLLKRQVEFSARTRRAGQSSKGRVRMITPTKTGRKWHVMVNQNPRRFAVVSALAASALPSESLVLARYAMARCERGRRSAVLVSRASIDVARRRMRSARHVHRYRIATRRRCEVEEHLAGCARFATWWYKVNKHTRSRVPIPAG
ncbi:hypothetical protein DFH06DRAFT_1126076 [Mycena polygramma]|nr:hypothetical protein DFH06DRAFT_1126076 [Mycena polygramma]